MNIEHMRAAVEAALDREIDDTVWDRFVRGREWKPEFAEFLAQHFDDEEADIVAALCEIDARDGEISDE